MGARDWTSDPDGGEADRRLQARIERELPSPARRLTREKHDAEDAVRDSLESAWRARRQLRDPEAAGGWLRRTLALCEQVCGGLQMQLAELNALVQGAR